MSDTPSHAPVKSIMPKWVRGPQDFVGGVALIAIALFALWASSDLQGMRGFSFGAGTAPRMFAYLLLGLGVAVMVVGLVTEGAHLAKYHWRGPLFVSLAILSFAVMIRPLGLVVSAFSSFLIAALGTHGNEMDGNHHRRRVPDGVLQPAVSLRAGSAVADAAQIYDPVRV